MYHYSVFFFKDEAFKVSKIDYTDIFPEDVSFGIDHGREVWLDSLRTGA